MTLAQIIDQYEQRQAAAPPALDYVPLAVALTPRGDVTVALHRLREQLRRLDADDRAHAAGQLARLLDELS
jgi:thioredoxin-like negative regulator of GroEL